MLLAPLLLGSAVSQAGENRSKLQKPSASEWRSLDGNSINCTVASDGPYSDYRRTSTSGLEWPKKSGKTACFTSDIWLIGCHTPSGLLRAAVMDYQSEYQPGSLPDRWVLSQAHRSLSFQQST